MPLKMRSLFKRKNKKNTNNNNNHDITTPVKSLNSTSGYGNDRSTPPIPIDRDGSTASHDSNEIYLSSSSNANSQQQQQQPYPPQASQSNNTAVDEQDAAMTASQFVNSSDDEMTNKRAQQPPTSPYTNATTSALNLRSHQGRNCQTKSREGVPIITAGGSDYFSPSAVRSGGNYATEGFYSKSKQVFGGKSRPKERPSARCSAFGGAPRYDWMDIETTAAIKIQATYRRLQTQNYLDANSLSTPGMRNRRARLQARYHSNHTTFNQSSADVPFPFSLCGVGLLFGDGTFEDDAIVDGIEKKKKQRRKVKEVREDEEKRRFRMRKKESQRLDEGIEVVESFDREEVDVEVGQSGGKSKSRSKSSKSSRGKSKKMSKSEFEPNEEEGVFL